MVYNGNTASPLSNFGFINVSIIGFMPTSAPKNLRLFFIIAGPGQVRLSILGATLLLFGCKAGCVCCLLIYVFPPSGRL